jgi:hypothetical protein
MYVDSLHPRMEDVYILAAFSFSFSLPLPVRASPFDDRRPGFGWLVVAVRTGALTLPLHSDAAPTA